MSKNRITRSEFIKMAATAAAATALGCSEYKSIAESMKNRKKSPVVIIGSGLGGLTCGAYLAKAGFPVTVVEQHSAPGGYATSFKRGNYEFDVSLHAVSVNNNATYEIFKNLGLLEKINLVQLEKTHRLISPGRDFIIPDRDPDAIIEAYSRFYPKEKKGIHDFIKRITSIEEEARRLFHHKDFIKILFPFQYSAMWKVRNLTLAELLNEHVSDPGARDLLSFLWGYYGLPPSQLSGFYYSVATGGYLKNGSHYIRTRSQSLSNALVEVIEKHKGTVLLNTTVREITVNNDAVDGIITTEGKKIPAGIVVSNASLPTTVNSLLPGSKHLSGYRKKIARYRPSISCFQVWLGLRGELRGKIPGCSISISPGPDSETRYQSILQGKYEKAGIGIAIYDNYYEGYSKPGTSTVSLICSSGYEPWRPYEDDYFRGNKNKYNSEKQRVTDILIRKAEKGLIPGLSSMIDTVESATPLTNIAYTGNTEGAIYGYEQSMDNSYMNRIENRTPLEGLYIASAWGNPGGGYTGVMRGGEDAFRSIIADIT